MSLRGHSVIVDPALWSGELEELAKRLVPIVGQPSRQLLDRLKTGPMTLETDLTFQSAEALQNRLNALGVSSDIQNESNPAPDTFDFGEMDLDLDALFSEVENLPGDSSAILTETSDPNPRTTQMGFATQVADAFHEDKKEEPSGWGDIFPELASSDAAPVSKAPISPFQLDKESKPSPAPTKKPIETPKPKAAESTPTPAKPTPKPQPSQPPTLPPSLDLLAQKQLPKAESKPEASAWGSIEPELTPPDPPALEPVAPKPERVQTPQRPVEPEQPTMSAAAFIDQIVGKQDEVGPYVPTGFDDAYEHAPSVAVALSVIAPGAGHVYNGADEKAVIIAAKSLLIKPWIDSIREASEHAEKIKTYHRPKPEKGSFRRALIHVLGFWMVIGFALTATYFVATHYVFHESEAKELQKIQPVDIRNAHANARTKVVESRLRGLEVVRAELQKEVKPVFTMPEAERVRRLYSVGVERCREKDYSACSAIMKKVVKLDPLYRSALVLQTWASEQVTAKTKKPMPDVGVVPTLTDLEKSELGNNVDLP